MFRMGLDKLTHRLFSDFSRIWAVLPGSLRLSANWVFFCIFIQAILEVGSILSMSFLALSISMPEFILQYPVAQLILKHFPSLNILAADPRLLALAASGGVVLLIAFKNFMFAYVTVKSTNFAERLALYAGGILFRQYLYSPYIQHLAGDSSEMFQALNWRVSLSSLTTNLMNVYTYISITLALSITVIAFTPMEILFEIVFLGVCAGIVYKALKQKMRQAGENAAEWSRAENKVTLNAMRGIRETLIYQQQGVFFEKFRQACQDGLRDRTFLNVAPPMPTWILETAGFFVIFAAIFLMVEVNDASMGRITTVVTIIMLTAWRVLPLLNRALSALISIQGSRHPAMQCLKSVEKALSNPIPEYEQADVDFHFNDKIELKNADFAYMPPEKFDETKNGAQEEENDNKEDLEEVNSQDQKPGLCLKNISLEIPCGKRIGIVGRSGAGKSTLILLLSGLAKPIAGEMLVDGQELAGSTLAAYRKAVGFVPQNPYIMGGSIAENVSFCQWGKPWDEEKVLKACEMAEFDIAMTRGIDAGLGQDGAGLSGGQAQRLSIARALYADPQILIFDEATSALDTGVEKAIMKTIFSLPHNITTITIAHRLDTVAACDIIYWIEDGMIMDRGAPDRILPLYSEFLEKQLQKTHGDFPAASK